MDWVLMVTTLFVNSGLGWWKGARWIWLLHSLNAIAWGVYSWLTGQWGFVGLSVVTFGIDVFSAYRNKKERLYYASELWDEKGVPVVLNRGIAVQIVHSEKPWESDKKRHEHLS